MSDMPIRVAATRLVLRWSLKLGFWSFVRRRLPLLSSRNPITLPLSDPDAIEGLGASRADGVRGVCAWQVGVRTRDIGGRLQRARRPVEEHVRTRFLHVQ